MVGETHREGFILTEMPQMARHVRHPKRLASGMGVCLALTPWNTLGPLVTFISFETVGDVGAVVTFVLAIFVWRALLVLR